MLKYLFVESLKDQLGKIQHDHHHYHHRKVSLQPVSDLPVTTLTTGTGKLTIEHQVEQPKHPYINKYEYGQRMTKLPSFVSSSGLDYHPSLSSSQQLPSLSSLPVSISSPLSSSLSAFVTNINNAERKTIKDYRSSSNVKNKSESIMGTKFPSSQGKSSISSSSSSVFFKPITHNNKPFWSIGHNESDVDYLDNMDNGNNKYLETFRTKDRKISNINKLFKNSFDEPTVAESELIETGKILFSS